MSHHLLPEVRRIAEGANHIVEISNGKLGYASTFMMAGAVHVTTMSHHYYADPMLADMAKEEGKIWQYVQALPTVAKIPPCDILSIDGYHTYDQL